MGMSMHRIRLFGVPDGIGSLSGRVRIRVGDEGFVREEQEISMT